MSFEQTRVDQHVGYRNGRTANFRHQGTGLSVPGLINGRPATEDEAAAQERAYQRSRDDTAAQLTIAPWQSTVRAEQWAGVHDALRTVRDA